MKCVREEEIKKGFGRYLQMAVAEPVCIESTHQPVVVLLAFKEYERLKQLEDMYWGERSLEAEAEGYIGEEESMKFVREARKSA
jgi:PHD/YefM family antitoxin component YafN of YafNO toxin-antitoxin module